MLFSLNEALDVVLVIGLGFWVVFAMAIGLAPGEIEQKAVPNEGIDRSARNALLAAPIGVLFGGLLGVLFYALAREQVLGLEGWSGGFERTNLLTRVFGLIGGLIGGMFVGLRAGGEACLRHLVLRLWLTRDGFTPWNYVRFLDHAADRILLRKVGGGYMFIHRMLLEYFAARYVEPGTTPRREVSSRDHQSD